MSAGANKEQDHEARTIGLFELALFHTSNGNPRLIITAELNYLLKMRSGEPGILSAPKRIKMDGS